jgi:tRNA(Ile)-lysidine synthase
MQSSFEHYLKEVLGLRRDASYLLGVSGGMDSVAMAELFHRSGLRFAIAHCNFQLRGKESDGDETFVRSLARTYRVPFFSVKFATQDEAESKGISIQMAARDLRYDWFSSVCDAEGYDYIAVAHHKDDQAETFFINLLRGTGIHGLHGILPLQGRVIRPMMFAGREDISAFIRSNKLKYRDDSSNASMKYIRNRIRKEVIPLLTSIAPEFPAALQKTIARIAEAEVIYNQSVELARKKLLHESHGRHTLALEVIRSLNPAHTLLFEILSPFGFNGEQVSDLLKAIGKSGSRTFLSPGFMLEKQRTRIVISKREKETGPGEEVQIKKSDRSVLSPVHLTLKKQKHSPRYQIDTDPSVASLDLGKLEFPLIIRKWRPGDHFHPFGMNKSKKVSDFLIDSKLSAEQKKKTYVLLSGNKIAWIIGQRIDHRFRITHQTESILQIKVIC